MYAAPLAAMTAEARGLDKVRAASAGTSGTEFDDLGRLFSRRAASVLPGAFEEEGPPWAHPARSEARRTTPRDLLD
jgi:hypothetical protein